LPCRTLTPTHPHVYGSGVLGCAQQHLGSVVPKRDNLQSISVSQLRSRHDCSTGGRVTGSYLLPLPPTATVHPPTSPKPGHHCPAAPLPRCCAAGGRDHQHTAPLVFAPVFAPWLSHGITTQQRNSTSAKHINSTAVQRAHRAWPSTAGTALSTDAAPACTTRHTQGRPSVPYVRLSALLDCDAGCGREQR
jgi:hypothetical protein